MSRLVRGGHFGPAGDRYAIDQSLVVDDIAQELCKAFGLGAIVVGPDYVTRGAMGEIWYVRTEAGSFALKELFSWVDCDPLPFDVAVQHIACLAGLRLPAPVVVDGEAVTTVGEHRYRAYEWVDLADKLAPPVAARRARDVGETLATIHRLDIDIPSDMTVDGWYSTPPHQDRFDELEEQAHQSGERWSAHLTEARAIIGELTSLVEEPRGASAICHRDFDPSNVLPERDTGELVVLDWENVGPLAIDQELGATLHAWTTSTTDGVPDIGSAQALLDAYHDADGPAHLNGTGSFSMSACTALNFLVVMADQALDAHADEHHRDFGRRQVHDLLDRGLKNLLAAIPALGTLE